MIAGSVDESQTFYRAHTPEWASQPLSGAGAARNGGRLNRPGTHALYLSTSADTAIAEYRQGGPLMPPLTLVAYRARLSSVADFSRGYEPGRWDPLWQELSCNWKQLRMLERIEPPTWTLADMVLAAGHSAILYPSLRGTGTNLAVYLDALRPADRLTHMDPGHLLPRDRSSWT